MIKKLSLILALLLFGSAYAMELSDSKNTKNDDDCPNLSSLENRISSLQKAQISKAIKREIIIDASNAFIAIKLGDPHLHDAIKLLLKAFSLEMIRE